MKKQRLDEWITIKDDDYADRQFKTTYRSTIKFCDWLEQLGVLNPKSKLNILDIGTGNLFANYDTANLVLYGKSNPVDGLKVIGKYVRSLHAKDGKYPTNPYELGQEVPIPTGEVDFPAVISSLKKLNFGGSIIIEYELADSTSDYLLKTKAYLEKLINS